MLLFIKSVKLRLRLITLFFVAVGAVWSAGAHDWHRQDDPQFANLPFISPYASGPKAGAVKLLASAKYFSTSDAGAVSASSPPTSFAPATLGAANLFAQTFLKFNPAVRFWWDTNNFYVESDGTPAHNMMEGISSWQRQIPLPKYYFGDNIWALPLYPMPTNSPLLIATNRFTQGAIALAANGVPIFNPYNNTGKISAQIGELDYWGGHCGRGDDYHYHAAPLHLTNTLGIALPVAFAMDGYPVFGLVEPDGSSFNTNTLDIVRGHTNNTGTYHYHASIDFPYINGGFHGVIDEIINTNGQGQVATQAGAQPSGQGPRPSGTPLAGAYIQTLTNIAPDQFQMFYSVPSNSPPTNYWLYTLHRASNTVTVTYSSYGSAYEVTTTNYSGWKTAPALTSTNEPLVTVQPTNTTKAAGSTATFTLSAAGFGTLAYQWFKDGVEMSDGGKISGVNTTALTITNVQIADMAGYSAVVTNTVGNTLSASAVLTVNGAPTNTPPTLAPISNRIIIPGQTLLITNVANDAETPGLLTFSLNSSLPGPTINPADGLITWVTTTNNANSTNQLTVVVADNGSPNMLATQSCTVTVVGTRSISQGLATTVVSNLFPAGQRVSGVGTITAFDGTVWTVPAATPFAASPKAPDLWNQNAGVTPTNIAAAATAIANLTTNVIDADGEVITGYIFCDNYFELFINGVLVGVDPVPYTPFNSCVVKFKARRPITYAVRLVDWEENLGVGTELNAGDPNHAGDGGFIASFSDGTVTGPNWKAQSFYISPLDNPNLVVEMPDGSHNSSAASNSTTLGTNAYALHYLVPTNWFSKSFNHSNWPAATTFTEAQVGVNNQWAYLNFPAQFGSSGAQFIWSGNLVLDNEVIVRFTGPAPATNTAPVFSAVATNRYVISGGDTITVTNTATDADLPAQTLTYSLLTAPGGATINSGNGVVNWITTTNNSGTSNLFRVVVTDNGSPNLTATNSFTAFVRSAKPNVVIIVTDDHGYHDLSAHGAEAPTPNMDRLGSEGIRLERFYATPVCSVTRSTLLTGRTTLRTSVGNARGLHFAEHTLPQTFKAAGYQAFMVGKWHLGGFYNNDTNTVINGVTNLVVKEGLDFEPQYHGWDFHYGQYGGAINYSTHFSVEPGHQVLDWWLNGVSVVETGWSSDLEADKAVSLLQGRDPSQPVILYLAINAVHPGVSAPASYLNKYLSIANVQRRTMVAALDQMDVGIGRVLDTIDSEGIRTNTLVVFFSDNGADTNSGGLNIPLRGTKNDYFEGGIHTPAAVRWPGVIPAGVTNCNQFISVADWFPTICAATGVTPLNTKPFDGTNVWPLLLGATNGEFNPTNYRGKPLFSSSASAQAGAAVYDVFSNGTNLTMFKLLHYKPTGSAVFTNLLFDIINDPLETNDVAADPAYTNIVLALTASYTATAVVEKYGPYIGVHPQGQSANAGSNVTLFAMTTVYTTPLGVQWRKNGTNIAGATSYAAVDNNVYLTTLNLANVTAADAATYDVVVTNAASGWPNSLNSLPAVLTVLSNGGSFLTITSVTNSPAAPTSNDTVSVTATLASSSAITQALLTYSTGSGGAQTNTVFTETMANTATGGTGGWDGTGANNPWTVTSTAGAGNIKQTTAANHGTGNICGLEFGKGSASATATMVHTTDAINASGTAGTVKFWVATANLTAGLGWNFQTATDAAGTIWTTRTNESAGVNHVHQEYTCNLTAPELVSTLRLRFQFVGNGTGGPTGPKTQIDDITVVTTTTGGPATVNVAMADDGAHQDGAAGDGVYGGAIPPFTNGTTVSYYLTAANNGGQSATNPIGAPASQFSYTVAAAVNTPPSLTAQIDRTVNPAFTLLVTNVATDSDLPAQTLTFSLLSPPANASIIPSTGVFSFTPSVGQLGTTNTITVVVTDSGTPTLSATNNFKAIVVSNTAPVLAAIANRTHNAGDTVLVTNVTTDAEAPPQVLSYSLTTAPAGASINPGSGLITWTTTGANAGTTTNFTVVVADNGVPSLNASRSFTVTIAASSNSVWSMLKLPDSGQTTSYTTTPGEDSDYSINPPSYTDNGNGTTTDNVTGLMWQKADGGEMTISNALLFAQTNLNPANFAGYNDWRMPTIHELISILNNDRSNPALDTNYFTSPGPVAFNEVYWWSRDQLHNGTNQWCANAGGGKGPKPISETVSAGGTLNYRVRGVRGAPAPATNSPIHHLVNNGNGTITDSDSGLTWQQAEIGATTDWTNALIYAEGLVLGGFQDWRLPNLKELESLNDETLTNPSIDTNYFPGAKSARYWSSTAQNNNPTNAWFNEFIAGITSQASRTTAYWVRAVRGGLSNNAPALTAISNRTLNAGFTLQFTNTATDAETAPGFLAFSLLTSLPNAALNPASGVFTWRAPVAQAGTSNAVRVIVADSGSPILTVTQLFYITVNPLSNRPGVTPLGLLGNQFQLQITGDFGPDYTVQASTNLAAWTNLYTTNSPVTPFLWLDPNANSYTSRFYRVLLGP